MAEETYHLGGEMEVFETELSAIQKATTIARKYAHEHQEMKQVCILSDNQEPIRRIRTGKAGSGLYMVLSSRQGILALQGSNANQNGD